MKHPVEKRLDVIKALLSREINISKATDLLSCSRRSIERYRKALVQKGEMGLKDHNLEQQIMNGMPIEASGEVFWKTRLRV